MLSIILPSHNEKDVDVFISQLEREFPDEQIILSNDRYGKGKGWAVRQGLKEVEEDIVVILDSDGDIPARMLKRLIPFLDDFHVVVGTKRINHHCYIRRMVTHLSRAYIKIMFGLNVETQTGIKIFRKKFIKPWFSDGYIFDVEMLANAHRLGARMIEVPVEVEIKEKLTKGVLWKTLKESIILKFRLLSLARK